MAHLTAQPSVNDRKEIQLVAERILPFLSSKCFLAQLLEPLRVNRPELQRTCQAESSPSSDRRMIQRKMLFIFAPELPLSKIPDSPEDMIFVILLKTWQDGDQASEQRRNPSFEIARLRSTC